MTNHAVLMKEIETLPPFCLGEVIDFVAWIKQRKLTTAVLPNISETMLMSQASLAKDWNSKEEDEAWENL